MKTNIKNLLKTRKTLITLFLLLYFTVSTHAQSFDDSCKGVVEEAFQAMPETMNHTVRSGICDRNIYRLLQAIHQNNCVFSDMKVIFFFHDSLIDGRPVSWDQIETINVTSPWRGEQKWYYHAVLEWDNQVYDYDFNKNPTSLSLEDYISEMFPLATLNQLAIRMIPASDYLSEYVYQDTYESLSSPFILAWKELKRLTTFSDRFKNTGYYLFDLDYRYPKIEAQEFLQNQF